MKPAKSFNHRTSLHRLFVQGRVSLVEDGELQRNLPQPNDRVGCRLAKGFCFRCGFDLCFCHAREDSTRKGGRFVQSLAMAVRRSPSPHGSLQDAPYAVGEAPLQIAPVLTIPRKDLTFGRWHISTKPFYQSEWFIMMAGTAPSNRLAEYVKVKHPQLA